MNNERTQTIQRIRFRVRKCKNRIGRELNEVLHNPSGDHKWRGEGKSSRFVCLL